MISREELAEELENQHYKRNLEFVEPFFGCIPMQASGTIDGLEFYFRYEQGRASIRVGKPWEDDGGSELGINFNFLESALTCSLDNITDDIWGELDEYQLRRTFNYLIENLKPTDRKSNGKQRVYK